MTQINFYFSPDYLSQLGDGDLRYSLLSFPVRSLISLGRIHQKRERLTVDDKKEIDKSLSGYLKAYDFIEVEKI